MEDGFVKIKSKSRSCSEGVAAALWRRQEQQVERVISSLKFCSLSPILEGLE